MPSSFDRNNPLRRRQAKAWQHDAAFRKKVYLLELKYLGSGLAIPFLPIAIKSIVENRGRSFTFFVPFLLLSIIASLSFLVIFAVKFGRMIANYQPLVSPKATPQAKRPDSAPAAPSAASTPNVRICGKCGAVQPEGSLFCNQCGASLSISEDTTDTTAPDLPNKTLTDDSEDFFVQN